MRSLPETCFKILFHQGLCIPIDPIWTRLSPMNQCFWSTRLSSWIASSRPLFWPDSVPINGPWRGNESRAFLARSTRPGAQVCESKRNYPQEHGKGPAEIRREKPKMGDPGSRREDAFGLSAVLPPFFAREWPNVGVWWHREPQEAESKRSSDVLRPTKFA